MLRESLILLVSAVSALFHTLGGRACRFHPSCSAYAIEALRTRPLLPASGLILGRLSSCHPFHPGGFDPLPKGSA